MIKFNWPDLDLTQPVEKQRTLEKNLAEYQAVLRIVEEWAAANQFWKLKTDAPRPVHQYWSTTAATGDEITLYYQERTTRDPRWPMELMIAFDPDSSPPYLQLAMSEGFGREPSEKLRRVHADLVARLQKRFGNETFTASIW